MIFLSTVFFADSPHYDIVGTHVRRSILLEDNHIYMAETLKYKVLEEVEIDGTTHAVDTEVELTSEVATPLVEEGKIALVKEDGE